MDRNKTNFQRLERHFRPMLAQFAPTDAKIHFHVSASNLGTSMRPRIIADVTVYITGGPESTRTLDLCPDGGGWFLQTPLGMRLRHDGDSAGATLLRRCMADAKADYMDALFRGDRA